MPESKPSPFLLTAALLWVFGFLLFFYWQNLDNNSSVSRGTLWVGVVGNLPTLLNPFDISHPSVDHVDAGWHLLPQRWPFLQAAGILLLAAWCIGALITRPLLPAGVSRTERFVLQSGVGLSAQSAWTLFCGAGSWLTPVSVLAPGVICLVGLLVAFALYGRLTANSAVSGARTESDSLPVRFWCLAIFAASPFVILIMLNGMTPPYDFDVREYHLQGPKEWFLAGRISFLGHNVYTSFPFLSEMLSLSAMVVTGDWNDGALAGKELLATFQLLTTLAVFATARRWFGTSSGLIASIIYLSVPWTYRISLTAYAEGAATFYLISTLMCATIVKTSDGHIRTRRSVLLTGLLAGSAMAAKYPGVLSVVIPVGFLLIWSFRRDPRKMLTLSGIYAAGVLITVGPWLIRNLHDTGNPVYPLVYSIFGADDWSPEMDAKWERAHSSSDHTLIGMLSHLRSVLVGSDWTSGLLFGLAVPSILLLRYKSQIRWLWFMVLWMLVTWWGLTHRIDRFWIPILPAVAVLAGATWTLFSTRLWRIPLLTAIISGTLFNLQLWRTELPGYQAGLVDLPTMRTLPIRRDFQYLNRHLSADDRILMIGEAEVFDLQIPHAYNTVFDESLFEQWTADPTDDRQWSARRRSKSAADIRAELHKRGITHVYVNWLEILRYRQPGSYTYTDYVTPARLRQLVDAKVLSAPKSLLPNRKWDDRSESDRNIIAGWPGYKDLLTDPLYDGKRRWHPIRLYRVK